MSQTTPDWKALYPFESHYVEIEGLRYHYLDEGEGPVLLMSHGNPTWSFFFRELVKAFSPRYRVVVPDHIGCGLSEKPGEHAYPFTLARRIDDLGALIESLDLRDITLIAHDWGGAIGMGAAAAVPERFSRFVLMNTAAFRSERIPGRINVCRIPGLGRFCVQGMNLFVQAALRMASNRPGGLSPEVQAGLAAPYDSWKNRRAVFRFVLDIPMDERHASYKTLTDLEKALPALADRPTCFIWGMRDWCFPEEFLDRFLEIFPGATVHRIADAGHYLVEDAPEEVIEYIDRFLMKTNSS